MNWFATKRHSQARTEIQATRTVRGWRYQVVDGVRTYGVYATQDQATAMYRECVASWYREAARLMEIRDADFEIDSQYALKSRTR